MPGDNTRSSLPPVSLVITNYNGRRLLEKYLPGIVRATSQYGGETEIVIADDCSTDDSADFVRAEYSGIKIVVTRKNVGFLQNAMMGVIAADNRIIVLLNNDVDVSPDFIAPLVSHFDDPLVFAVIAKSLIPMAENFNESMAYAAFENGLLEKRQAGLYPEFEKTIVNPQPSFYPTGGYSAFDKGKFLRLNGFDTLFSPGYWEDVDVGFRAWRAGWKVVYEPRSILYHESHASMGRSDILELRNQILFTWKNLSGAKRWLSHAGCFLKFHIRALDRKDTDARFRSKAFLAALKRLPFALYRRWTIPGDRQRSGEEILSMLAPPSDSDMNLRVAISRLDEFRREPGFKCLLIDPPGRQSGINVGLAYLAGSLVQAGIQVKALDLNNTFPEASRESVCRYIREGGFSLVGYSIKTSTYTNAVGLACFIKERFPELIHVAGGPHVTLCTEEFIRENPWCDFAISGEGEEAIAGLCGLIREQVPKEPESIAGVVRLEDGVLVGEEGQRIDNLASLPFPLYEVFECMEFKNSEYPLVTGRGCPYNCIYCSVGKISGKIWRSREVDEMIAELRLARERYGITRFNILDDTFSQSSARAKEFCRALMESGLALKWTCGNGIRADRVDEELARLMKESGCEMVMLGVESGDPEVFSRIKKGESLEQVREAIAILRESGLAVGGFFIVGLPGDSIKGIRKTLDFIRDTGLAWSHFSMLAPCPGTELWEWVERNEMLSHSTEDASHFLGSIEPVFETKSFTSKQMKKAFVMAYAETGFLDSLIPADLGRMHRRLRKFMLLARYDIKALVKKTWGFITGKKGD